MAVRLAGAGHDVSLAARGATLATVRSEGLRLVEPDGSVTTAQDLRASDDLALLGPQDLVLLAVKAHQIAEVAEQLPLLYQETTVVVPLQNGIPWWFFQKFPGPFAGHRLRTLDPDGSIERHIPVDRVIGSIAYPAVHREAPGAIRLVEGDRFPVGELDGARTERVAEVSRVLAGAGFTSRVVTDIRSHLWVKAWGNLSFNPISALTGASLGAICRFAPTRALATRMMEEAAAVATKLSLRVRLSIEQRIEGAEKVGDHTTSMLQDVRDGRALEVEPLVGSFLELGELTDTPMPATQAVYALVSLLDRNRDVAAN